jgi:nucleoid-associated protein YgaU/DNA-binding SARP family transcriptional activator
VTRSEKLRALLVLAGFLALLAGTPVLLAWLTRQAPDLAVHWPAIDTGIFAPPVLVQLEHWWSQDTWPQLVFGFEDGNLIVWMVALAGWACWIVLVWHTLAELVVCVRLGVAYAHQRLAGIGPRAWISGAVTTVLIGLSPGTAHAAGPARQPSAATAPRHPGTVRGEPGELGAADRESLTAGGVADPQAPRQSDPFVLDADVRPELPRYTVVPGDTLWDLARRYLGDPQRYRDILGLNADRLPSGGGVLWPGWVLLLPAEATGLPAQGDSLPAGTTWVTVARGDTLTSIAERHLGDREAWTVLWQLNDHRRQPDGRVLRDPNLLLPGWRVAVPPSTPDTDRTPDTPLTNPFPPQQAQAPAPPPSGSATPASPPTTRERPPTPSGAPAPTPGTGLVQLPSGGLAGLGLAVAVAAAVEVLRGRRRHIRDIPADEDDDVVEVVPPLPQALQILHRAGHTTRSPNRENGEDDEAAEHGLPVRARWPPEPVFVTGYDPHGQPRQLDLAAVAGLGLTGAGAAGVVRGVLAAELLARYQQPTEIYLLDDTTPHTLAGTHHPGEADTDEDQHDDRRQPDSPALAGIAGVHLATSDAHQHRMLAGLEAELTRRARLIAETNNPVEAAHREDERQPSPGWAALRRAQPDLHLPTIAVLATPAAEDTSEVTGRLAAICDQGRSMGIHGLLLGAWPTEIDLDAQGTVTATAGAGSDILLGTRLQQLTAAEFREITELARTLRTPAQSTPDTPAQHTEGTMPASAPLQPDTAPPAASTETTGGMVGATATMTAFPATANDREATEDPTNAQSPAAVQAPARVVDEAPVARLQLLGAMRLHVAGRDVTGLRSLSWELLAYLGTHPDGASPGLLEDELLADRHSGNPRNLVQKAVSHARMLLREATGGRQADFITTRAGRYHLDHDHLTCDVLELHRVLHTARTSRDDEARRHAREHLAKLCRSGPPLPDAGYHWAEEVRQYLTSRVLPVLRALATTLADTDPESALEILETATIWEPYAESLYRDTIAIHQRLGHPEAAQATYRLLTARLADIDQAPENTTHSLVADMAT